MPYPHPIRLRAAWTTSPATGDESSAIKHLSSAVAAPIVVFRRGFHRPAGLTPLERLWLVATHTPAGLAWLNGRLLGELAPGGAEWNITAAADAFNKLAVWQADRQSSGAAGADAQHAMPEGDFRLEVRLKTEI